MIQTNNYFIILVISNSSKWNFIIIIIDFIL